MAQGLGLKAYIGFRIQGLGFMGSGRCLAVLCVFWDFRLLWEVFLEFPKKPRLWMVWKMLPAW